MKFDNIMSFNLKKEPLYCPHALGQLNLKSDRFTNCFKCPWGTIYDNNDTVDPYEMINTPELKELRKSLMNGEWPSNKNCESCRSSEEIGYESTRQKELKDAHESQGMNLDWYLNNVNEDGSIKAINYLEFRFRNSCNLACRHCSPDYSSQWNKIVEGRNSVSKLYKKKPNTVSPSQGVSTKKWVEFIISNIDKIEEQTSLGTTNTAKTDLKSKLFIIETAGGEPFFQVEFYDLLQELNNYPEYKKKINFGITTNGIIVTKFKNIDVKSLLSGFGNLNIVLSLDASENFYQYFRSRGTWQQATSGVIPLVKDIIKDNHVELAFSVTPTIFQCLRAEDMYKDFSKLLERDLNRRDVIISHLTYPNYLQMRWMPDGLKTKLLNQFEEIKTRCEQNSGLLRLIEQPIKELSYNKINKNEQADNWKMFCNVTKELDDAHSTDVFDYFPELKEYWVE